MGFHDLTNAKEKQVLPLLSVQGQDDSVNAAGKIFVKLAWVGILPPVTTPSREHRARWGPRFWSSE
jgi:hypothetical protein